MAEKSGEKLNKKQADALPQLPSDQVSNAHASGDGALERSVEPLSPRENDKESDSPAEDQNHIPY